MQPIPIVYEEPHFLLVNKPAALFSQAPPGIDSLQARLIAQLKARDQHPGEPFVGLPHRLDRGTSGIMLIARNQRALKRFGQQFQSRKVIKHYLAVVEGVLASASAACGHQSDGSAAQERQRSATLPATQRWEDYVRKIPDLPRAEVVSSDAEGAKLAIALVDCLCRVAADGVATQSLLKVQLETGRMHQIRVQAAARGLPVVGDASYGATLPWRPTLALPQSAGSDADQTISSDDPAVASSTEEAVLDSVPHVGQAAVADGSRADEAHGHPPIALHAWSLEFRHPQTAKSLRFVAPVPASWQQLPTELLECIAGLA